MDILTECQLVFSSLENLNPLKMVLIRSWVYIKKTMTMTKD